MILLSYFLLLSHFSSALAQPIVTPPSTALPANSYRHRNPEDLPYWAPETRREYECYLEGSSNRSVFTGAKRDSYRRWLRNPNSQPQGISKLEMKADMNIKNRAIASFILQDDQRKFPTIF
jgi:hypothetical protein